MTEPTSSDSGQTPADLAAAARDSGIEQLEAVKGRLAEGAERVADAVEDTADNLEADGDEAVSGFGRSLAGLTRQLAGGLRERDIDQFARELGTLAQRNPGLFLAGSVALGFGVARFFKAQPPRAARAFATDDWQAGETLDERTSYDADEELDLSSNARSAASTSDVDARPQSANSESGDTQS